MPSRGPRSGPSSKVEVPSPLAQPSLPGRLGLPPTRRPKVLGWSSPTAMAGGRWQPPWPRHGWPQARYRDGVQPSWPSRRWRCPTATGRCAWRPRGSSPPTWKPMPRGACQAANPPPRWPTAAPSAARLKPPMRTTSPGWRASGPTAWESRCGCCSAGRTWCGAAPSGLPSPRDCAPTAVAVCWSGGRVGPTSPR